MPRIRFAVVVALLFAWSAPGAASAQDVGVAGTVQGIIKDPTGGVMVSVTVTLANRVSGFTRTAQTDASGKFAFRNIPPNPYELTASAQGFTTLRRTVDVRATVPITLDLTLQLAAATTSVEVTGQAQLVESDPMAHTDIDQAVVSKLPIDTTQGLNQVITLATPGVVADSNGFFHPIGDHAQTQFAIDNQPVTDQQSKLYSNQMSQDAVQAMEVVTGVAPAEYGGKSSLVVQIVTKSGLDQSKPTGTVTASMGSFKSPSAEVNLGIGSHNVGNFVSASGLRSDRYLDSPEFETLNGSGHSASVFDRVDFRSDAAGAVHVNLMGARSSFNVPNSYDQEAAGQRQHQQISTFNIAPGYSKVIGNRIVLTAGGYARQDRVIYSPSPDPFSDTPATVSQHRRLTDTGVKVDVAYVQGRHNLKIGTEIDATFLTEDFQLGLTDPTLNSPCADAGGNPSEDTALTDPGQCAGAGLTANDGFIPGLLPFDLSRGGGLFTFNDTGTIKTQAVYVQDEISAGPATFNVGLRADRYAGLTTTSLLEPRAGVALEHKATGSVFRASWGRTLETPYNENLLLSSSTGAGGLTDSVFGYQQVDPLKPGIRREFEIGVQQQVGPWVVFDVSYLRKHTDNAYDFDVLFDTPIVFPISWDHSDISSISGRVDLVEIKGFRAFTVFGHNVARFFNPENGGLLFDSPLPNGAFRIDHDQKFQQTTNLQYTFDKAHGIWGAFVWRYDSGLVAGEVPDYATALTLDGDQQAAIGLYCGDTFATPSAPLTGCDLANRGATRLQIPADGTENDDTNPPRIAPRNLFDLSIGADRLFGGPHQRVKVQFSLINLTNRIALYNFLSTFSGTHFVTPRAWKITVGVGF
jgi:Carboxypeptidase regulatory-like domain